MSANYGHHLIPEAFADLKRTDMPKIIKVTSLFWGLKEIAGPKNQPVLMEMASKLEIDTGKPLGYTADSIPWCGLFMAYVVMSSGREVVENPLWAQNWAKLGQEVQVSDASLGDILVWQRKDSQGKIAGGHVAPYIGHVKGHGFAAAGGNQGDTVQPAVFTSNTEWKAGASARLIAVRRPYYTSKPLTAIPVMRNIEDVRVGAAMV